MSLAFGVILLGLWGNLFVSLQVSVLFDSPGCFHGSVLLSLFSLFVQRARFSGEILDFVRVFIAAHP